MGNKDFVVVYSAEYERWLRQMGYPCPSTRLTNRAPTVTDILFAVDKFPSMKTRTNQPYLDLLSEKGELAVTIDYPNWDNPDEVAKYIAMRGSPEWEVALVVELCHLCGQLVIYPDSGASAIILDAGIDTSHFIDVWKQSYQQTDDWRFVHETLYS